jgi:hypothetical protein
MGFYFVMGLGKTIEAGMIYKEIDKREELRISLIVEV